jgi:hypothetical protein
MNAGTFGRFILNEMQKSGIYMYNGILAAVIENERRNCTKKGAILDRIDIGPAFLLANTDISLFIIPGLDKNDRGDKDKDVDDREPKQGSE